LLNADQAGRATRRTAVILIAGLSHAELAELHSCHAPGCRHFEVALFGFYASLALYSGWTTLVAAAPQYKEYSMGVLLLGPVTSWLRKLHSSAARQTQEF
jgi:hypothetical protein